MNTTTDSTTAPNASGTALRDEAVLFEQYKLAVEMAAGISSRRQAANNLFIGLISGLVALYSLVGNESVPWERVLWWQLALPLFIVVLCFVWWSTIYAYRRINKAKWSVIYGLEEQLPARPFQAEEAALAGGSFLLTKLELAIPLVVGFVFLVLAVWPLLSLIEHR